MLFNIVIGILFGVLVGWVASLFTKRGTKIGAIINIGLGIAGAFMGGFLMNKYGTSDMVSFIYYGILVAIMGVGLLFFLVGIIRRPT